MIPTIKEILRMLQENKCTFGQAEAWLTQRAGDDERREMFAAMAMQGYCSCIGTSQATRLIADWSWEMAEAMLASQRDAALERSSKEKP